MAGVEQLERALEAALVVGNLVTCCYSAGGHTGQTKRSGGQTQTRRQTPKPLFAKYKRVSRVGERDERLRSPEFQDAAIEAKAKAEGVATRDYPVELDVSGAKRSRVVLDEIVGAIEAGELAGIVVYNLSRLSRLKPRDRIELVERIEQAGGRIVSASESFDPSTPEGRFQRDLFFSLARLEWERAAEGFDAAKRNAIASGIAIKSRAPFGLRFNEGHGLEPDPPLALGMMCSMWYWLGSSVRRQR